MRPDATRDAGLRELGVQRRLSQISHHSDGRPRAHGERVRLFDDYKAELKKEKKRLARELHPDTNLEETEEVQAERAKRFAQIVAAVNFITGLSVRPPARRRPQGVLIVTGIRMASGFRSTSTPMNTVTGFWSDVSTTGG